MADFDPFKLSVDSDGVPEAFKLTPPPVSEDDVRSVIQRARSEAAEADIVKVIRTARASTPEAVQEAQREEIQAARKQRFFRNLFELRARSSKPPSADDLRTAESLRLAQTHGLDPQFVRDNLDALWPSWAKAQQNPDQWQEQNPELAEFIWQHPHYFDLAAEDKKVPAFLRGLRNLTDAAVVAGTSIALRAQGGIAEGAGALAQILEDIAPVAGRDRGLNRNVSADFQGLGQQVNTALKGAADTVDEALVSNHTRLAFQNSQFDGKWNEPSTWTFGKDPSLKGASFMFINVFGQMAPIIAASTFSGGLATAVVAAAQSAGGASESARATIDEWAANDTLTEKSAYYRNLLAEGRSEDEALDLTKQAAAKLAALAAAPIGAAGGVFEHAVLTPLHPLFRGGAQQEILKRIVASTVAEPVQEISESYAGQAGRNVAAGAPVGTELGAGTFPDLIVSAGMGFGFGGIGARRAIIGSVKSALSARRVEGTLDILGSPLARGAPDDVAALIEEHGGATVYYAQADAVQQILAEQGKTAAEVFGPEMAQQLEAAAKDGDRVALPLGLLLKQEDALSRPILENSATDPDLPTYKEEQEFKAEVDAEAKRLQQLDETVQPEGETGESEVSEYEQRLADQFEKALQERGESKADARNKVMLWRAEIRTHAAREGADPAALFQHLEVRLQNEGGAAAVVASQKGPAEPPVPTGFVRVYSGHDAAHGPAVGGTGHWFSTSKQYAEGYAGKHENGAVSYVDLPENHPMFEAEEGQGPREGFTFNANLDEATARQAKPLTAQRGSVLRGTTAVVDVPADAPEASRDLTQRFLQMSREERLQKFARDTNTRLLNTRGFSLLPPDPTRPFVAHIGVEGIAFVNDTMGHEAGNALYRIVGRALHELAPDAAKIGGDFAVRVRDQAHLDQILAGLNARGELRGLRVTGALGASFEAAGRTHGANKATAEAAGARAARKTRPLGLQEGATFETGPNEPGPLPEGVEPAFDALTPAQQFEAIHVEPETGLLTSEGFHARPVKGHQLFLDVDGLREANERFGLEGGDKILRKLGEIVTDLGGAEHDAAHVSGDEFQAQNDDPIVLRVFAETLAERAEGVQIRLRDVNTGEVVVLNGIGVTFGDGSTNVEADQALNRAKEERKAEGIRGTPESFARRISPAEPGSAVRGAGRVGEGGGGPRQRFAPAAKRLILTLTPDANPSTFFHESAHIFLERAAHLLERGASPALHKAFTQLAEWSGYGTLERMRAMQQEAAALQAKPDRIPEEEARLTELNAPHERFARAFEAYVMEGKAPSRFLRPAFAQYRVWMNEVYGDIRELGVELNPEIRDVMDRMLATEKEIADAMLSSGDWFSFFQTPEQMGVSPEEFARLKELQVKATSKAHLLAHRKMLRDRLRANEATWKKKLDEKVEKFWEAYRALPARRALRFLQGFITNPETGTEGFMGRVYLDRKLVTEMVGPQGANAFSLKRNGVNPDEVAGMFGYESGKTMLQDILEVSKTDEKTWAKAQAEKEMIAEHPGLLEDRAQLEQAIQDSIHNQDLGKLLVGQLNVLYRMEPNPAGKPLRVRRPGLYLRAVQRAAEARVRQEKIGGLNPKHAHASAEAAGMNALKALAKGNVAQAIAFVEKQLLQNARYTALAAARDSKAKFLRTARLLSRASVRAEIGKGSDTNVLLRRGIDTLLAKLELRKPGEGEEHVTVEELNQIGTLVEDAGGKLVGVNLLSEILHGQKKWKDLTVEQMDVVHGALRTIRAAAQTNNTVLFNGERMDANEAAAHLIAEISAGRDGRRIDDSGTRVARIKESLRGLAGELERIETVVQVMGGVNNIGSWAYGLILEPMMRGHYQENALLRQYAKPVYDAFMKIPGKIRRRGMQRIDGSVFFPNAVDTFEPPQTVHQLIVLVLNSGNPGNLARLGTGRGIVKDQIRAAVEATFTAKEAAALMKWAQSVWDAAEAMWPQARAIQERQTGIPPEKVSAEPLTIHGKTYRGGYFPLRYRYDSEVQSDSGSVANFLSREFIPPGTPHGHLENRAVKHDAVVDLDVSGITRGLRHVAHDIAFRETIQSVARLLLRRDVQATVRKHYGANVHGHLLQWVKDVGRMQIVGDGNHARWWNGLARWFRRSSMNAVLGYRIPTAGADAPNMLLPVTAGQLTMGELTQGIDTAFRDRAKVQEMFEKLGSLQEIQGGVMEAYQREVDRLGRGQLTSGGPLAAYLDYQFALYEHISAFFAAPVAIAAYQRTLNRGGTEAEAINYANHVIRETFASKSAINAAPILRDKGFMGTALTFFGFINGVAWQRARLIFEPALKEKTWTGKVQTLPRVGAQMLAFVLVYQHFAELIMGRGPEDDEDWTTWFLRKGAMSVPSMIPILGDAAGGVEALASGRAPSIRGSPIADAQVRLFRAYSKAKSSKEKSDILFAYYELAAFATGTPTYPVTTVGRYAVDVAKGTEKPKHPGQLAKGLIYGPERKK